MSTVPRALALAVLLSVAPVAVGVLLAAPEEEPAGPPPYSGTDLADVDTSTIALARAPFCDRIPGEAVAAVLGDDAEVTAVDYGNGDRAKVAGRRDVMHEYACRYDAGPERAAAWVFAPPVPASQARELIGAAAEEKGCTRVPDAPSYGDPSVAVRCTEKSRTTLTFAGLFGDAWLTCQVTAGATDAAAADLLDRTGRWCVAVAEAAAS